MRFLLLGDEPPRAQHWPTNVAFQEATLRGVLQRVRSSLGVATSKQLTVDGGGSKISDFKPMLAHIFPELLEAGGYDGGRCDFWGYMQEDQFLGDLRAFLEPATLRKHDIICPLLAPLHHAGPFMVYRNVERVNALYKKSKQWRSVVRSAEYRAFDEWWGSTLTDHMSEVVRRESAAGRLKAYNAQPDTDKKVWLQDDYIYAAFAPKKDTKAAAAAAAAAQNESDGPADAWASVRWYDDSMLLTWRMGEDGVGRLWSGSGSAATQSLWADGAGQRALVHLIGSKTKRSLRNLVAGGDFVRLAARTTEFHISTRGIFLREPSTPAGVSVDASGALESAAPSPEADSRASWYSGVFPGAHALIQPSVLSSSLAQLAALGRPKAEGELSDRVDATLPCADAAVYDTKGKKKKKRSKDKSRSPKEVAPFKLGLTGCRRPKLASLPDDDR